VAGKFECGRRSAGPVGRGAEGKDCVVASVYYFASITFEKNFTDEFGACARCIGRVGEVPWRIEGFGQGKVLFRYDSAGDALEIC
jgi:hypothetical protein